MLYEALGCLILLFYVLLMRYPKARWVNYLPMAAFGIIMGSTLGGRSETYHYPLMFVASMAFVLSLERIVSRTVPYRNKALVRALILVGVALYLLLRLL